MSKHLTTGNKVYLTFQLKQVMSTVTRDYCNKCSLPSVFNFSNKIKKILYKAWSQSLTRKYYKKSLQIFLVHIKKYGTIFYSCLPLWSFWGWWERTWRPPKLEPSLVWFLLFILVESNGFSSFSKPRLLTSFQKSLKFSKSSQKVERRGWENFFAG